jgi:hypothetical protein
MVLNRVCLAAIGVAALAWSGLASAQQYRADEFLNLDLSRAVLSSKPLGPAASFMQGPLNVTMDRGREAAPASAELVIDPKTVAMATVHADNTSTAKAEPRPATTHTRVVQQARVERAAPHKPRALLALHGRDPIEAQARDTSVQVWPCRSGGICNWKR